MKVLIVSPFPKKGDSTVSFSALGIYTSRLLSILPKDNNYTVAAQDTVKPYEYLGSKVIPVWKRNSILFFARILGESLRGKYKVVHLQHEVYAYGTNQYLFPYLFIFLEFMLKIFRKKTVVTVHGVLPSEILNNTFIKNSGVINLGWLVSFGTFIMYYFTCLFSDKVIVHNTKIKKYLTSSYQVKSSKINVIPIPLFNFTDNQITSPTFNKLTSGYKYVFLYFGYLSMYKSLDTLLQAFTSLNLQKYNACLLISGDVPDRLKSNTEYTTWIRSFKAKYRAKNIIWDTRFIPENELKHYFASSSVLVIPYKFLVSSSGPLTFAMSSKLPVLASDSFEGVLAPTFIFGSTPEHLQEKAERFMQSAVFRKELTNSVSNQKKLWSDKNITKMYNDFYLQI